MSRDVARWATTGVLMSLLAAPPTHAETPLTDDLGLEGPSEESIVREATEAVAEHGTSVRESRRARRRRNARFSNGPRRVPVARGVSLERARSLGLGTEDAADHLLSHPPEDAWIEAAGGEATEDLLWPVEQGRYGRGFGYVRRTLPDKRHNGVDIVAPEGAPILAVADGIVAYSDNGIHGFGNCVLVVHANGWVSVYAHAFRTTVPAGWRVTRGERIGFVGTTGISHGPHLHFELRMNGRAVNPLPYFEGRPWVEAYRRWRAAVAAGTWAPPSEHRTLPGPSRDPRERADDAALRARLEQAEAEALRATDVDEASFPAAVASAVGTVERARAILDEAPDPRLLESLDVRLFRNLLWPVRGGTLDAGYTSSRRGVGFRAPTGEAVRAAADGLVVYVGSELRGVGLAVVVLHPNGWVTVYGSLGTADVHAGDTILRGQWLGHVGADRAYFQLRDGGAIADPTPLLVQAPGAESPDVVASR